ncbi:VanZ family protein [Fibrella forsythiae]|uniref:VanZ family protein n=1 Tax=Fibrella forsythiae TaxID=2817061 RepID=A0ABS3JNS3_9BACT|nr:VanZ family protein [Fibrella forsythiae]MBO0951655.1 VanZ family protein [Fibrella forsythiae]
MFRALLNPILLKLAAIGWTITISIGCFWPSSHLPDLSHNRDKYLHAVIFFLFAILWRMAGWSVTRVVAVGLLYAGAIELVQALIPEIHRSGDWLDFVVDAIGLVIGLPLSNRILRLTKLQEV